MLNNNLSKPDFMRPVTYRLVSIGIILLLLYFGKSVLLPIAFATIFAMALAAPSRYLEKKGLSRSLAATVTVIIAVLILGGIFSFLISQIVNFKNDLPQFQAKFNDLVAGIQHFLQNKFRLSPQVLNNNIEPLANRIFNETPNMIGRMLSVISTSLIYVVFTLIYTLLILNYKSNIIIFVDISFRHIEGDAVQQIVGKTQNVIKGYIYGLLIEMLVVASMLSIGFLCLGIKYALLLAVISAIFNVVPYIGFITATIISIVVSFSTNSPHAALWVGIISILVHLIDSNILLPAVVGNKVKINAMATITGVFIGSLLWGIPGMFLAVPVVAILKVIFDAIPTLMHWGVLLGGSLKTPKQRKKLIVKK